MVRRREASFAILWTLGGRFSDAPKAQAIKLVTFTMVYAQLDTCFMVHVGESRCGWTATYLMLMVRLPWKASLIELGRLAGRARRPNSQTATNHGLQYSVLTDGWRNGFLLT